MKASLQHKLQQLEVPPPPAVWTKIAATLDNENVPADTRLSQKLDQAQLAPPAALWSKIEAEMNAGQSSPARVLTPNFQWKKLAVAAVFIALIGVIAFYFLNSNPPQQPGIAFTLPKKKPNPTPRSNDTQRSIAMVPSTETSTVPASQRVIRRKPLVKTAVAYASNRSHTSPRNSITDDAIGTPAEAPLYELSTVSALQPVSISAPPIRDKKGDLILDLSTIKNRDDDYITVTGPNGKQTKMSTKFLSCIGYMNANSSAELDSRAQRCKLQFEEWRNRLLAEPGFIPTANNFFDIFELKDLLEEM